jgi:hypothetical protein
MGAILKNYSDKKIKFVEEEVYYYNKRQTDYFAIAKDDKQRLTIDSWLRCRDAVHSTLSKSKKKDRFLFCHEINKEKNIAAFIQFIERKLELKTLTLFEPTQFEDVICVRPSKWWMERAMKRSLFTILIRAGKYFKRNKNNLADVVEQGTYLTNTSYAFYRFLDGYTRYTGNITGWYNQFYYNGLKHEQPDIKKVEELLVKP